MKSQNCIKSHSHHAKQNATKEILRSFGQQTGWWAQPPSSFPFQ